ncbi:MAG: Methylamine utilization protein MauD [Steroidobacteraceae bacterium]|nr:Methylamine utilization protein MauD [Steroidobacteraceae bacterium]
MDNILLVSNLILWLFVIGLALLVFALSRQIGVLYERVAPAGALMINRKLEVGAIAPVVPVQDLNTGKTIRVGGGQARSQLLFFLSPNCPVCKTLLPALKSVKSAEADWLDVIFASDGEPEAHRDFIERQGLVGETYVSSEALGRQYGVSKLPFAVLIDHKGVIASLGLVNSREHFESLFESMERGVPSLQAYLHAANATALTAEQK